MLIMLMMLIVAAGLSGHFNWKEEEDRLIKAVCSFQRPLKRSGPAFEAMVMIILLSTYGYFVRVLKLVKGVDDRVKTFTNTKRSKSTMLAEDWLVEHRQAFEVAVNLQNSRQILRLVFLKPLQVCLLQLVYFHLDLLTSFLAEVR